MRSVVIGPILCDGEAVPASEASISVLDIGFQRGYGAFETLRSYAGCPFRMKQHLDRLQATADMLRMPLPDRETLERWVLDRAAEGDVSVRIFVSGGLDPANPGDVSQTFVFAEEFPDDFPPQRLQPRPAPWHPDGRDYELTGSKTLSYVFNVAVRLAATAEGFDDALLIGSSGHVLEGPTSSIGWTKGDRLFMPSLDLHVLASVTAGAVADIAGDAGLVVESGAFDLEHLLGADEVMVFSTLSEVRPVIAVGDTTFTPGDATARLQEAFRREVSSHCGLSNGDV